MSDKIIYAVDTYRKGNAPFFLVDNPQQKTKRQILNQIRRSGYVT